jgi:hypothetical protein
MPQAAVPAVSAVPGGFAATSVTWVSPDEAFVLGTAPCAHYLSGDGGAHGRPAGQPSPDGDAGSLAATTTGRLTIATHSAASWLFYSASEGQAWRIVFQRGDGGTGWADLGFTTAADGVVVYGPADSDGNATQWPGQLLLTGDAGASWSRVRF